jgi:hypothetical protein
MFDSFPTPKFRVAMVVCHLLCAKHETESKPSLSVVGGRKKKMAAATSESFNLSKVSIDPPPAVNPRRRTRDLTISEYSVFQELRAQFLSLDLPADHLDAQRLADAIVRKDTAGQPLSHDDVNSLETVLVRLEPLPRVRERFRVMRHAWCQTSGVAENSLAPEPSDEAGLRAATEQMLSDLHLMLTSSRRNQELCAKLFRTILGSTLGLIAGLTVFGVFCCLTSGMYFDGTFKGSLWWKMVWAVPYLPALFYAMMAGAVGAFLSSVLRVQDLAARRSAALPVVDDPGLLSVAIAPFLGAFAGFLVFSCLAAHLVPLQQDLLPTLGLPNPMRWHPFHGILAEGPVDIASNFKILLVGLASGFSERFFPDVMDWLSKGIMPLPPKS